MILHRHARMTHFTFLKLVRMFKESFFLSSRFWIIFFISLFPMEIPSSTPSPLLVQNSNLRQHRRLISLLSYYEKKSAMRKHASRTIDAGVSTHRTWPTDRHANVRAWRREPRPLWESVISGSGEKQIFPSTRYFRLGNVVGAALVKAIKTQF